MAKIKSFIIQHSYFANYGDYTSSRKTNDRVTISNYLAIKQQIMQLIEQDDVNGLSQLLQSEFVYKETGRYEKVGHDSFPKQQFVLVTWGTSGFIYETPNYGCGQQDSYIFAEHPVAPVLEELVHHKEDYKQCMQQASLACQYALGNFNGIDLKETDLDELDLSKVDLSHCDLMELSGINQEMLDSCKSYLGAQLPGGLIPYWDDAKKKQVLNQIQQLSLYGQQLTASRDEEGKSKGKLIKELAENLTDKVTKAEKFNGNFQKDFLQTLHQHDEELNHKRYGNAKAVIVNLSLFVLGFGIGYGLLILGHKALTGRFTFFARSESEQKITSIQQKIVCNT